MSLAPAELEARLRLHALPGIGPRRHQRLLACFDSASAALSAPASAWHALAMPETAIAARRSAPVRDSARAALQWLEGPRHHLLLPDQPGWPALLAELADPPPLLYVAGDPALLECPQLAMVGSRRASLPGCDNARLFARSLAAAGFVVTSGLALGIDTAAHRGALEGEGQTVAVLGTGLQRIYPARNQTLARRIVESGGALVSELPLDSAPLAANFPRRNRIISGLSLGVLVVEASPQSGSLITARLAAEQGREVYAIPGSIHHPGARGCHQLIREGAQLVETVEDILQALRGWQNLPPAAAPSPSRAGQEMGEESDPLLALLRAGPLDTDALAGQVELSLPQLLVRLTELELEGRICSEAGRWMFCR